MEFWSWLVVAVVFQFVIVVFGEVIVRKVGLSNNKGTRRKILAISLLPLLLVFLLTRPIVVIYFPDELFENSKLTLNSGTNVSIDTINDHSRQIEMLKDEIKQVQKNLDEINDYYGFLSFFLLISFGTYLLYIIVDNEIDKDKDKVEKFPLGLNDVGRS